MLRRSLIPLVVLLAVLALPAAAGAAVDWLHVARAPGADGGELSGKQALHQARAVLDGRGARTGLDLTPLLKRVAVAMPHMSDRDQARARKLLARPTDSSGSPEEPPYSVSEHAPYCPAGSHFCIHWVTTTEDAPSLTDSDADGVPDYVEQTAAIFDHVYDVENGQLGWRNPKSDGGRGCPGHAASCMNRTDVYLKQVGDEFLYGFAATDSGQSGNTRSAYLVVDNDFAEPIFSSYASNLEPLQVTAAHEYNHVLQYSYDIRVNTWFFESTATWMEDVVYTDVNDYRQYIPGWAQLSMVPLTTEDPNGDLTSKIYGDMVWNVWLQARFGADVVRKAWEHAQDSRPVKHYSPGAYDKALNDKKSTFFRAFTRFAADTAEWRAANSPFEEGSTFPDMDRAVGTNNAVYTLKVDGDRIGLSRLPHTAFGLVNVAPTAKKRIKLIVTTTRGLRAAVALIGRTGTPTGGAMKVSLKRLARGGRGVAVLSDADQFQRLTIALINGDARTSGVRFASDDWDYRPGISFEARLSSDFTPPRVTKRSPGAGRHGVSRRAAVKVRFSERVFGARRSTAVLRGPNGRKVRAKVTLTGKGRKLRIKPRTKLRSHKRYTVRLGSSIRDHGSNPLRASSRTWSFVTRR